MRRLAAVLVLATATACTSGPAPSASEGAGRHPRSMAALGDSITRAFAACGRSGDCPEASWATGTVAEVESHAQRLDLDDPATTDNLAVSGAQVAGLASQVQAAVAAESDYVTVLIGANDACAPDETAMTPVADYTAAFDAALDDLASGLPDARILVLSVPDLHRLWEVGKDRPEVRRAWESAGTCRSMLGGAADSSDEARARRERVRARLQAYNAAMAAACERHATQCRHDAGAVFEHRFGLEDLSSLDYWHPSARGQATLADLAWRADP